METFYYHYTEKLNIDSFIRDGIYSGSSFTIDEYSFSAESARHSLCVGR